LRVRFGVSDFGFEARTYKKFRNELQFLTRVVFHTFAPTYSTHKNMTNPVTEPNLTPESTPSKKNRTWLWALAGLASAAAVGFVISRTAAKPKLPPKNFSADWHIIERIGELLEAASIEGVEVYVNRGRVILIAEDSRQRDLDAVLVPISELTGVLSVGVSANTVKKEHSLEK
jgi:nitrate reductase NapAB chaperone NapD